MVTTGKIRIKCPSLDNKVIKVLIYCSLLIYRYPWGWAELGKGYDIGGIFGGLVQMKSVEFLIRFWHWKYCLMWHFFLFLTIYHSIIIMNRAAWAVIPSQIVEITCVGCHIRFARICSPLLIDDVMNGVIFINSLALWPLAPLSLYNTLNKLLSDMYRHGSDLLQL